MIGRHTSALLAVIVSQLIGLIGSIVLLAIAAEAAPGGTSLLWAAGAGASGVIGIGCFYYALSRGTMGVIAPLAALIGAGVPVLVDLYGGDALPMVRVLGIAAALAAVVLISLPGGQASVDDRRRLRLDMAELPYVVGSGLGFAGFFLLIDRASADGAVWWPLAVVRLVGLILVVGAVAVAASRSRGTWRVRGRHVLGLTRLKGHAPALAPAFVVLMLAGLGDLGGNVFFLLATQAGELAVAVILSSLYPVVTTILAAILLHERLRPIQVGGVVLATISVVLLR